MEVFNMPIIILLGIGVFWAVCKIHEICTTNYHAYTEEELDAMGKDMLGKSTKECQEILKKYRRRYK